MFRLYNKYALKMELKKADNGSRTRLSSLGSWRSTDELYLHVRYYITLSE